MQHTALRLNFHRKWCQPSPQSFFRDEKMKNEGDFKKGDRLISTEQAATILGISRRTLEGWRRGLKPSNEQPRFYRVGRKAMYSEAEICIWVNRLKAA